MNILHGTNVLHGTQLSRDNSAYNIQSGPASLQTFHTCVQGYVKIYALRVEVTVFDTGVMLFHAYKRSRNSRYGSVL